VGREEGLGYGAEKRGRGETRVGEKREEGEGEKREEGEVGEEEGGKGARRGRWEREAEKREDSCLD